jgi:hypothetical protein
MKKFDSWDFKDHFPEEELNDILPISLRAYSLLNRNRDELKSNDSAIHIVGFLDSLEALDYHFDNFKRLKENNNITSKQSHEVVAYLNRIGQVYYFLKSAFIKAIIPNSLQDCSKIEELSVFRMKNTAHRSIDHPKKETEEYRNRQTLSLLPIATSPIYDKQCYRIPIENPSGITEYIHFTPEIDHDIVMGQCYKLLVKTINSLKAN